MKKCKKSKLTLATLLCSLALLFAASAFPLQVSAAAPPDTETAEPCADIIRWVYDFRDGKIYKRLWNGTKGIWIGDWIYVRDL